MKENQLRLLRSKVFSLMRVCEMNRELNYFEIQEFHTVLRSIYKDVGDMQIEMFPKRAKKKVWFHKISIKKFLECLS